MKCLSLKQPFADFVVDGMKSIELRGWNTKFRGPLLIQASMKPDISVCTKRSINPANLVRGAILGRAELYDVKEYKTEEEFIRDADKHLALKGAYNYPHRYGFLLKDAVRFNKPIPLKGKLGIFDVEV
jgi:hypothetical protein